MNDTITKTRRKAGRPFAPVDYDVLSELCGLMCTAEECSAILGISSDTLARALRRDHDLTFPAYFKRHSAPALVRLRQAQFETATSGSVPMQIWLGKQWLGQREPDKQIQDDDITDLLRRLLAS